MDNKKKIIFGLLAGIIFIIAFILNLLFPPKPFIKSAHADGIVPDPAPGVDMDALLDEYGYFIPLNQITQSDNIVDNVPFLKGWLPEDYTYGDFLLDTASSIIGSASGINSETVDIGIQAIQTIIEAEGLWFDTTSGLIKAGPSVYQGLVDIQREYGYDYPSSGPVVGGWYEVPFNSVEYTANNYLRYLGFEDGGATTQLYVCFYHGRNSGNPFVVFASYVSGQTGYIREYMSNNNGSSWVQAGSVGIYLRNTYQGSESLGFYGTHNISSYGFPSDVLPWYSVYGSDTEALAELFGWDGTPEGGDGDPVFNGNVYIDNTIPPINILDIPGNDGRSRSIQRNIDINNNITNNYGGYNNVNLSPKLEDIPNNHVYELPSYPEIPHDLPAVTFEYPEIVANEEISAGLEGLSPLWVTLLTMGGSFIVLKVIL